MKAIIIVELPDDIDLTKCRANINIEKIKDCGYDYAPYTFRLYCPLKPLPQELDILNLPGDPNNWSFVHYETLGYEEGWNDCLKEITGETE